VPKMNNNLMKAAGKSVRHGLLAKTKHGLGGRIIDGDLLLEVRGSDFRGCKTIWRSSVNSGIFFYSDRLY
jgi:hypothetical protein